MINRQNYEDFFMMYADGELSAADRQAVDLFVRENPDFGEELELFKQLHLADESISFTGKQSLYRFESGEINAANHEVQFLLYVDNELDEVSKEKVEVFVLQNPVYQQAFTLLKQTRLPLETLVFRDKASLYREEEKTPVAFMYWGRMAAAAIFIGLGVMVWMLLPSDHSSPNNLAKLSNSSGAGKSNSGKTQSEKLEKQLTEKETDIIAAANGGKSNTKIQTVKKKVDGVTGEPVKEDIIAYTRVMPPVEDIEPTTVTANNNTDEEGATTERILANNVLQQNAGIKNIAQHTDDQTQSPQVHTAVYKELDTDDEKKSLYLGSLEINKDKLRGFFRKAGSIFRNKAKQEEEARTETTATPAGIALK